MLTCTCTCTCTFFGSAASTRIARRIGTARAVLYGALVSGVSVLLLPATWSLHSLPLFALGNFGFAAGGAVGSIVTRTHRMTDSPPELLSRVMATVRFLSWGVIPIGALVAGGIAVLLGARLALLIVCSLALVGFLVLLLSPVRSRRELSDLIEDVPTTE
jgi:MFS family permease